MITSLKKWGKCCIYAWLLTARNSFSAIYCIKYPEQQARLAKHLKAIKDIADARDNLNGNGTDFRKLIAQEQIEWGDVHKELYVSARLKTQSTKPSNGGKDIQ